MKNSVGKAGIIIGLWISLAHALPIANRTTHDMVVTLREAACKPNGQTIVSAMGYSNIPVAHSFDQAHVVLEWIAQTPFSLTNNILGYLPLCMPHQKTTTASLGIESITRPLTPASYEHNSINNQDIVILYTKKGKTNTLLVGNSLRKALSRTALNRLKMIA